METKNIRHFDMKLRTMVKLLQGQHFDYDKYLIICFFVKIFLYGQWNMVSEKEKKWKIKIVANINLETVIYDF